MNQPQLIELGLIIFACVSEQLTQQYNPWSSRTPGVDAELAVPKITNPEAWLIEHVVPTPETVIPTSHIDESNLFEVTFTSTEGADAAMLNRIKKIIKN